MLNLRLAGRESMERAIALFERGAQRDPRLRRSDGRAGRRPRAQRRRFSSRPDLFERSLALADRAAGRSPRRCATRTCSVGDTLLAMGRSTKPSPRCAKASACSPIGQPRTAASRARTGWARAQVDDAIKEFEADAAAQPGGRLHASAARDALHAARRFRSGRAASRATPSGCRIRRCPAPPA